MMPSKKIIFLSLVSSAEISSAFNPNSVPTHRSHPLSSSYKASRYTSLAPSPVMSTGKSVRARLGQNRGFHTTYSTRNDLLDDVDGIGEILNPDFLGDLSSKALPILPLAEDHDITQMLDGDFLPSSEMAGHEKVFSEQLGPEILTKLGRNNIVKAPTEDSLPSSALERQEDDEEEVIETPGIRQIMNFAIPAIGVWLCSPLLSLIDTSTVGLLSGTAQQAALSPAVAVADYSALMLAFMFTATTNLVSAAQEKDRGIEGKPRTTKTLIASLQLSGYVGSVIGAALIVLARVSLRAIIGNDQIDPEVFSAAMKYLRIRALGMPAAAIIGSAQSACLGLKDIKSPLYVLLAAAVVNLLGDLIFVRSSHPLIGGAAGAAWATTISQYAALFMFLKWLQNKPQSAADSVTALSSPAEPTGRPSSPRTLERYKSRESLRSLRMLRTNTQDNRMNRLPAGRLSMVANMVHAVKGSVQRNKKEQPKKMPYSRGFLEGKMRTRDVWSLPNRESAMEFWPYFLPVTATVVGRVSGFVAMGHVVSSSIGTIAMAAQQIIIAIFYALCPIVDCLSQTAQSFVPPLFEKKRSLQRTKALRRVSRDLWKAGIILGSVCVGVVECIPFLCKLFTGDPSVAFEVNAIVPYLAAFFAAHGLMCSSEGVLLARRDLGFLGQAYGAAFFVVPWFMMRVKKAALSGVGTVNLASVWKVFIVYQLIRASSWCLRVSHLNRKSESDLRNLSDNLGGDLSSSGV